MQATVVPQLQNTTISHRSRLMIVLRIRTIEELSLGGGQMLRVLVRGLVQEVRRLGMEGKVGIGNTMIRHHQG